MNLSWFVHVYIIARCPKCVYLFSILAIKVKYFKVIGKIIRNRISMLTLLFYISRLLLRLLLAVLKIHNCNTVRGNPFYGTYSVCSVRSQNQSQNIIWHQGKSLCTNKLHLYLQNFILKFCKYSP